VLAQPLDQPTILAIEQGASGELVVSIKPVRKAKSYELRYGVQGAGGAAPAAWSTLTRPNARPISVSGLAAGTTYAFQVRAYGQLGYTEYSDSMARMVILAGVIPTLPSSAEEGSFSHACKWFTGSMNAGNPAIYNIVGGPRSASAVARSLNEIDRRYNSN
jgi:hypothetical protein